MINGNIQVKGNVQGSLLSPLLLAAGYLSEPVFDRWPIDIIKVYS